MTTDRMHDNGLPVRGGRSLPAERGQASLRRLHCTAGRILNLSDGTTKKPACVPGRTFLELVRLSSSPSMLQARGEGRVGRDGTRSGPEDKAKAHVFSIPHDVVGAPGIVEEARMDSGAQVGLCVRETQRCSLTQGDERRVNCLHGKGMRGVLVAKSLQEAVHVAIPRSHNIKGRDGLA